MSQTQIEENVYNLKNVECFTLAGNNRQLTMLARTEASRKSLTKYFNMTYYKQNKDANNAGAAFMKNIDVNSIILIINFKY